MQPYMLSNLDFVKNSLLSMAVKSNSSWVTSSFSLRAPVFAHWCYCCRIAAAACRCCCGCCCCTCCSGCCVCVARQVQNCRVGSLHCLFCLFGKAPGLFDPVIVASLFGCPFGCSPDSSTPSRRPHVWSAVHTDPPCVFSTMSCVCSTHHALLALNSFPELFFLLPFGPPEPSLLSS